MAVFCVQVRSGIANRLEAVASVLRIRHGLDRFFASAVKVIQLKAELVFLELSILQRLLSAESDAAVSLIDVCDRPVLRVISHSRRFQRSVSLVISDLYGHRDLLRVRSPAISESRPGLGDLILICLSCIRFSICDLSEIGDPGCRKRYARRLGHRRSCCHCFQCEGRCYSLRPQCSIDSLCHLDLCFSFCRVGIGDGLVFGRICDIRRKCPITVIRHFHGRCDRSVARPACSPASVLCDRIGVGLARVGLRVIDRSEISCPGFCQCLARLLGHRRAVRRGHCEGRLRSARPCRSGYCLDRFELRCTACTVIICEAGSRNWRNVVTR